MLPRAVNSCSHFLHLHVLIFAFGLKRVMLILCFPLLAAFLFFRYVYFSGFCSRFSGVSGDVRGCRLLFPLPLLSWIVSFHLRATNCACWLEEMNVIYATCWQNIEICGRDYKSRNQSIWVWHVLIWAAYLLHAFGHKSGIPNSFEVMIWWVSQNKWTWRNLGWNQCFPFPFPLSLRPVTAC